MNTPMYHPVKLTRRQLQVLLLKAHGHTNESVARQLSITASTVNTHLSHIFRILDVASIGQAIAVGLVTGIIPAYLIRVPKQFTERLTP